MTNIKQLNQSNPFWDWISEMEKAGREQRNQDNNGEGPSQQEDEDDYERIPADFPVERNDPEHLPDFDGEKTPIGDNPNEPPPPPPEPHHPPPPEEHHPHHPPPPHGPPHHGPPRGGWGGRGRHHGGHRGGPHGHHGPHGPPFGGPWAAAGGMPPFASAWGGPWGDRRGGAGGCRGRGNRGNKWAQLFGMDSETFNMDALAHFLKDNFGIDPSGLRGQGHGQPKATTTGQGEGDRDFKPPADVFDTPDAYVIHVSLPGAKKEDVAVNWDGENSEVQVSGIIHRPGDEEFLKTLALEERDIGVFERKIVLGTKAEPAFVEAEGITARMEDGVLIVRLVKRKVELGEGVRKVDVL